jgi:hypothetical protein
VFIVVTEISHFTSCMVYGLFLQTVYLIKSHKNNFTMCFAGLQKFPLEKHRNGTQKSILLSFTALTKVITTMKKISGLVNRVCQF